MPSRLIAPALAAWLVASAAPAHADTERYAVVIGDNRGASDEQPLRYAESDAQRVADLLGDVGGVPGENQIVLRGKSADQVRRALIATNERIRTALRPPADTVLLVYYSGHGDADALHLGDSALPLRELEALVRGSPAAVRVLIIDACRSGSITRVKGGRPAPPLALATASPLLGEGPAEPVAHVDATLGASLPLWGRTYLGAELAAQTHLIFFNSRSGSRPELITVNLLCGVWL